MEREAATWDWTGTSWGPMSDDGESNIIRLPPLHPLRKINDVVNEAALHILIHMFPIPSDSRVWFSSTMMSFQLWMTLI